MFLPVALLFSSVLSVNPSWHPWKEPKQPPSYVSIQTDPDYQYVCIIDSQKNGQCADTSNLNWYSVGGPFDQLVVFKGGLFGVRGYNVVQYSPSAAQISWSESPFHFSPVSTDGDAVCAPVGNRIFCTRLSWGMMPRRNPILAMKQVKQVELKGDKLFVVHRDNTLAFAPFPQNLTLAQNLNWTTIPGSFDRIAYDGKVLLGLTSDGSVSVASSNLETNPDWQTVDGKMRAVAVGGGGKLVGIDYNSNVLVGAIPAQPPASN